MSGHSSTLAKHDIGSDGDQTAFGSASIQRSCASSQISPAAACSSDYTVAQKRPRRGGDRGRLPVSHAVERDCLSRARRCPCDAASDARPRSKNRTSRSRSQSSHETRRPVPAARRPVFADADTPTEADDPWLHPSRRRATTRLSMAEDAELPVASDEDIVVAGAESDAGAPVPNDGAIVPRRRVRVGAGYSSWRRDSMRFGADDGGALLRSITSMSSRTRSLPRPLLPG